MGDYEDFDRSESHPAQRYIIIIANDKMSLVPEGTDWRLLSDDEYASLERLGRRPVVLAADHLAILAQRDADHAAALRQCEAAWRDAADEEGERGRREGFTDAQGRAREAVLKEGFCTCPAVFNEAHHSTCMTTRILDALRPAPEATTEPLTKEDK